MITVVDQHSPWLMPSSTLANTIQPQRGAAMMSSGTGRPASQPATRTGLRPLPSPGWPGRARQPAGDQERLASDTVGELRREQVRQGLDRTEADGKGEDDGLRSQAKVGLGDQREDGALEPHHGADEGVDHDEQRELAPVGA